MPGLVWARAKSPKRENNASSTLKTLAPSRRACITPASHKFTGSAPRFSGISTEATPKLECLRRTFGLRPPKAATRGKPKKLERSFHLGRSPCRQAATFSLRRRANWHQHRHALAILRVLG